MYQNGCKFGVGVTAAALEHLRQKELLTVFNALPLLPNQVNTGIKSARNSGIAADMRHLLQQQHFGASLSGTHSRGEPCAACADHNDVPDALRCLNGRNCQC